MAPSVRGTIGIDITTGAVEDAKRNAHQNNIQNSIFFAGKAEEVGSIMGSTKLKISPSCLEVVHHFLSFNTLKGIDKNIRKICLSSRMADVWIDLPNIVVCTKRSS